MQMRLVMSFCVWELLRLARHRPRESPRLARPFVLVSCLNVRESVRPARPFYRESVRLARPLANVFVLEFACVRTSLDGVCVLMCLSLCV